MGSSGWNPTSMPGSVGGFTAQAARSFAPAAQDVAGEDRVSGSEAGAEQVTVCVETVKPEKKGDFERLLRDVIAPAAGRNQSRFRLLEPEAANPDGTWTYVTFYDAQTTSADCTRQSILLQEYGTQAAAEHEQIHRECRVGEAVVYQMSGSAW